MYQLSQNGDKQAKLFAELQLALSEKDSKITPATLEQLPYLKACIKETLRMFPVVLGNGRSLQSDAVIAGYNVPKGVSFIIFSLMRTGNSISLFASRRLMWFSRTTFCRTRKATSRNPQNSFPNGGWRTTSSRKVTFTGLSACHLGTEDERASEGGSPKRNWPFYSPRWFTFINHFSCNFHFHFLVLIS